MLMSNAQASASALGFHRLLEPFVELAERIGIQIRDIETAQRVCLAEAGEGHWLAFRVNSG